MTRPAIERQRAGAVIDEGATQREVVPSQLDPGRAAGKVMQMRPGLGGAEDGRQP